MGNFPFRILKSYLKLPPRRFVVRWILEAWKEIKPEIIKLSFKACAFNLATGGSQKTCSFTVKDKLCKAGKKMCKANCQSLHKKICKSL